MSLAQLLREHDGGYVHIKYQGPWSLKAQGSTAYCEQKQNCLSFRCFHGYTQLAALLPAATPSRNLRRKATGRQVTTGTRPPHTMSIALRANAIGKGIWTSSQQHLRTNVTTEHSACRSFSSANQRKSRCI